MFIEWRIEQAKLVEDPVMRKALRLRRLSSFRKFDQEQTIYDLYTAHEADFDSVKAELIALELEIQHDRNVGLWDKMYDLIINSNAASLYKQAFIDRQKSNAKNWQKDMDDGTKDIISSKTQRNDATAVP